MNKKEAALNEAYNQVINIAYKKAFDFFYKEALKKSVNKPYQEIADAIKKADYDARSEAFSVVNDQQEEIYAAIEEQFSKKRS